jgi:gliding motility-associated-like protein
MKGFIRFFTAVITLVLITRQSFSQVSPTPLSGHRLALNQRFDSSIIRTLSRQNPAFHRQMQLVQHSGKTLTTVHTFLSKNSKANSIQPLSTIHPLGALNCIDTSNNILTTESGEYIGPGAEILKMSDGGILIPGFHQQIAPPNYTFPYLLKYDASGNVIWSKGFDAANIYPLNYATAYKSFQLNDGSVLVAGSIGIPVAFNSREELILWKLDANGNVIWVHTDSCSIWTQYGGTMYISGMVQDPAGNIYLSGDQYAFDAISTHSLVIKMDAAGNIIWDKSFSFRASQCFGLLYLGGELSVYGTNPFVYMPDGSGNQTSYLWNLRINPATGDTLRTRCWYPDYGANSGWNCMLGKSSIQQLTNGNIALFGTPIADERNGVLPIVHAVAAEFDPSFNFLRGWMVASNVMSNYDNTRITEHASGRISFTYLSYLSGYSNDILFGTIEQGQIIKDRVIHERNYANLWSTNFINMSSNQDIEVQWMGDSVNKTEGLEFLRLHDSDTSSICTGTDTSADWLVPYAMLPYPRYHCDSISSNSFRRTNRTIPGPTDLTTQQQTACKLTSFCDSVKLFVNDAVLCAGQPAVFTCWRNPECGSRPNWLYDTTNLQADSILNDSTLQLIYKDQFQGKVYVSMNGTCGHLSDSIPFKVLPAEKSIALGPDGYLCPDSSLVLRPATGYSAYTWQDGSVADTMLVTGPGKYYVTVTNTCGLPMSDTIMIQQAPFLNFNVGPDEAFCLNDPVLLQAPGGYSQYTWRTGNNVNTYNGQSITVSPTVSSSYFASAQTSLGCVVRDTILITIQVPDPIHLGADTSFCRGDSILLNAGTGFQNYNWNTGESGATVWVHSQGTYSVRAQAADGCYSSDTLIVKNIFPLPVVTMDADNMLCEGTTRTLNAGNNYINYLWQNGTSSSTLVVATTGTYWVRVQNNHGCISSDTVIISQIISNPSGFLIPDTLICDGHPSKIQSEGQFSSYSWSTGETENFITVRKAGSYSLTVTDQYGCSATSSVVVETKQCLYGIFFPNGFTPNEDGVNDIYRPTVFGNLTKYQLQIFNRWGQKVFESEDYTKGWDGSLGNMTQVSGTYVWICHYQFVGEAEKKESGSVVLIR